MNPRQERALKALLEHPTQKKAAESAGIAPRTLRDYLADEEFKREYLKRVDAIMGDATRQAQQALNPAIATLREVAENELEKSSTRVAASRAILEYTARYVELTNILERIEKLEGEVNTK